MQLETTEQRLLAAPHPPVTQAIFYALFTGQCVHFVTSFDIVFEGNPFPFMWKFASP